MCVGVGEKGGGGNGKGGKKGGKEKGVCVCGRVGGLRCVSFLGMPGFEELRGQVGLPCKACPSDHLPLVVKMEFV